MKQKERGVPIAIAIPESLLKKLDSYIIKHKTNRSAVVCEELKKLLEK